MNLSREQRKQQTRQHFFDATLDLCIAGQGFSSISLRQVTAVAGVVPTAFYRHFSDMEALGAALVKERLADTLAALRAHMHLGRTRQFKEQIAKSVAVFLIGVDKHYKEWHFIASERFGGSMAVRAAIFDEIELFAQIMGEDLGLQPEFAHISAHDRNLLAKAGVNLSFSWIVGWLDSAMLDAQSKKSVREQMLNDAVRQMQMLLYGAYNWQSDF